MPNAEEKTIESIIEEMDMSVGERQTLAKYDKGIKLCRIFAFAVVLAFFVMFIVGVIFSLKAKLYLYCELGVMLVAACLFAVVYIVKVLRLKFVQSVYYKSTNSAINSPLKKD